MATDVPTDPEEYALYQFYGPNWRELSGRNYGRDTSRQRLNYDDSNMKFYNSIPYIQQVQQIYGMLNENKTQEELFRQQAIDQNMWDQSQEDQYQQNLQAIQTEMYDYLGKIDQYIIENPQRVNNFIDTPPVLGPPPGSPPPQEGMVPVPNLPGWTVWNGINTMAEVNWFNAKTGERFTAPHGGFSPPPGEGWERGEAKYEPLPPNLTRPKLPDATIMPVSPLFPSKSEQTAAAYSAMTANKQALEKAEQMSLSSPTSANNSYNFPATATAPAPAKPHAPNEGAAASTSRLSMSDQFIPRYERDEEKRVSVKSPTVVNKTIVKSTKVKAV